MCMYSGRPACFETIGRIEEREKECEGENSMPSTNHTLFTGRPSQTLTFIVFQTSGIRVARCREKQALYTDDEDVDRRSKVRSRTFQLISSEHEPMTIGRYLSVAGAWNCSTLIVRAASGGHLSKFVGRRLKETKHNPSRV